MRIQKSKNRLITEVGLSALKKQNLVDPFGFKAGSSMRSWMRVLLPYSAPLFGNTGER